jgi:hypothetical protein
MAAAVGYLRGALSRGLAEAPPAYIDRVLGPELVDQLEDLASIAHSVAQGVMQVAPGVLRGAVTGGPAGAVAGGLLGGAGSVLGATAPTATAPTTTTPARPRQPRLHRADPSQRRHLAPGPSPTQRHSSCCIPDEPDDDGEITGSLR